MYILKNVRKNKYLTYTGWKGADINGVMDLTDVIRFTENEARWSTINDTYQWVWYGSYTPLKELRKEIVYQ